MKPPTRQYASGPDLPITAHLDQVRRTLRGRDTAVLEAPPGAGKTTIVPLALLDEPWLKGKTILMLEPRRLAARAAARRMASLLNQRVGDTVGYRVHMDSAVGPRTRIEVLTEGILTRRLQHDQALEGVGLVIFDEFHERSIHADLGLALTLDAHAALRPDLRLMAMSATLDGSAVAQLMGDCPVISCEGRLFPVETHHFARDTGTRIEQTVVAAIRRALEDEHGSILVFLPGMADIRRVEDMLRRIITATSVLVAPLHGTLSRAAQDAAILPAPPGMRKIVLATSIAETSLTIEGVRVVIDSGLMRVPRFDPNSGMTSLETVRVTRSSADQRRGRAGRTGPGVCYRLWTEHEHASLEPFTAPEILTADLAPLALELAAWGIADPTELKWLDPPPLGAYAQARELLAELDAVDVKGALTPLGRRMADLGAHPRLGHMMVRGAAMGCAAQACDLAAILSERDVLRGGSDAADPDIRSRLDLLSHARHGADAVRLVHATARFWQQRLGTQDPGSRILDTGSSIRHPASGIQDPRCVPDPGCLLALAYPDRIAQRRPGSTGSFLMRNGSGALFTAPTPLANEEYLVVADLDAGGRSARIFLAAPYSLDDLLDQYGSQVVERRIVAWDDGKGAVIARRQRLLGAMALSDDPLADVTDDERTAALVAGIRLRGINCLPWDTPDRQWQARVTFLRATLGDQWPEVTDAVLLDSLEHWLAPHLAGMRKLDEVKKLELSVILRSLLPWQQQRTLDSNAPTHFTVPSGSAVPLDYSTGTPVLSVRVQEMFGLLDTPRVADGKVPVTIQFLSPAGRPVQVTQDLASFWRSTYNQVKKDLKGRYPRHYWPDDPLTATPTSRAKRRKM